MGDSDKLVDSGHHSYRFVEHRRHLDAFPGGHRCAERVTLVLHDWSSALGFDWAYRHASAVRGIAYMEAFVAAITSWSDWPDQAVATFQAIRSPAGEEMVLDHNFFVEEVLPTEVVRGLSEPEMAVYRRPYRMPGESRRPTLTWPRRYPLRANPRRPRRHHPLRRLARRVDGPGYSSRLVPAPCSRRTVRSRSWPNQTVATVTAGHMVPEDAPDEVGAAVASWLTGLP